MEKKILSVKEYAEQNSLAPTTVYRYIRIGKIPSIVKDGKKHVIVEHDLYFEGVSNETERYKTIIHELIRENMLLRKELSQIKQNLIENYKYEISLREYLKKLGFPKDSRKRIYKAALNLSQQDQRFQIINNRIYISPSRFTYNDILNIEVEE